MLRKTVAMERFVFTALVLFSLADNGASEMVSIQAQKDNTLFFTLAGNQSDGSGPFIRAGLSGETPGGDLRRGLIKFDVAANVPAGSTINSVTLTLHRSNTGNGVTSAQTISLHRVLADWGEGASNTGTNGRGATAQLNDATWTQRFFNAVPAQLWKTPGGDFDPDVSTSLSVPLQISTQILPFTWPSTPQFVADVQDFLDNPSTNFGWMIRGNEVTVRSAYRFSSRNNSNVSQRPVLTVMFTPPPPRIAGDVDNDGDVDREDVARLAMNFGKVGTGVGSAAWNMGDFNNDNTVGLLDLAIQQQHFGEDNTPSPPLVGVPEPTAGWLAALSMAAWAARRWRFRLAANAPAFLT
jgi:hypothetical protein